MCSKEQLKKMFFLLWFVVITGLQLQSMKPKESKDFTSQYPQGQVEMAEQNPAYQSVKEKQLYLVSELILRNIGDLTSLHKTKSTVESDKEKTLAGIEEFMPKISQMVDKNGQIISENLTQFADNLNKLLDVPGVKTNQKVLNIIGPMALKALRKFNASELCKKAPCLNLLKNLVTHWDRIDLDFVKKITKISSTKKEDFINQLQKREKVLGNQSAYNLLDYLDKMRAAVEKNKKTFTKNETLQHDEKQKIIIGAQKLFFNIIILYLSSESDYCACEGLSITQEIFQKKILEIQDVVRPLMGIAQKITAHANILTQEQLLLVTKTITEQVSKIMLMKKYKQLEVINKLLESLLKKPQSMELFVNKIKAASL